MTSSEENGAFCTNIKKIIIVSHEVLGSHFSKLHNDDQKYVEKSHLPMITHVHNRFSHAK